MVVSIYHALDYSQSTCLYVLVTSTLFSSAISPSGMKQQNVVKRDIMNWSPGGTPVTTTCG